MNVRDFRSDYAAYCSALELAHYQHRAGFNRELNLEPIYDRYGELFTRESIESLEHAFREVPESWETERSALGKLIQAAKLGYLHAQTQELTIQIARCSSAQHLNWAGERIPFNGVSKIVANEPAALSRREIVTRWIDMVSGCNDLRVARLEALHSAARDLGFDSYRTLYEDIHGAEYKRLAGTAQEFLEWTEDSYKSSLSWMTKRDLPDTAFEDLRYADYLYFQRLHHLDRYFRPEGLLKTYRNAMRDFGINVELQRSIQIDDTERPYKHPRAACFRIHPPEDIRLLLSPVGGAHDYTVFFHEAGHAQHFAWSSPELIGRYPEFLYAPDHSTTEGFAFLFSYLFLDSGWLIENRIGADTSHVREIVRELALVVCSSVRRRCGSLNYELTLHSSPQLSSEQASTSYADKLSHAISFKHDEALYLADTDDGFYSAAYLRAWAFEASLREYLRTRYGRRWWASRKCTDELIDLWNTSSRYTVEELASLIGLGEISFELLADGLMSAIKEN